MNDFTIYYKTELSVEEPWASDVKWDVFLSAFTSAERVLRVFDKANAPSKRWLVFPEYGYLPSECPPCNVYAPDMRDEAAFIKGMWDSLGDMQGKTLGIDITGFIRPYLIFLLRWLAENGVRKFDAIYTEPVVYKKRDQTRFSDESVTEVRQVAGYEGNHVTDVSRDVLVIGAGYDYPLIARVAESKQRSRKIQIFGLPSLRADMYQENVLRAYNAEESVGRGTVIDESRSFFTAANDPFVTASVLQEISRRVSMDQPYTNLYLSPISTKPQVLGFALYYLAECMTKPVSIIFPFCHAYDQETSTGLARIWKYTVELPTL